MEKPSSKHSSANYGPFALIILPLKTLISFKILCFPFIVFFSTAAPALALNTATAHAKATTDFCTPLTSRRSLASDGVSNISSVITQDVFAQFFDQHNIAGCAGKDFYNVSSFLEAASAFPGFGTTGTSSSSKRELAAFFAYASEVTTGGCYIESTNRSFVGCIETSEWGCAPGKKYYGRGPLQLSWNYNYGPAGKAIGFDGINNPDVVASDPVITFKASLWYWMTVQPSQTYSCHQAILTQGVGYAEVVKLINGVQIDDNLLQERINVYDSFCIILGVQPNIAPSPFSTSLIGSDGGLTNPSTSKHRSCIGSLCGTAVKVVVFVFVMAGVVIILCLIYYGVSQYRKHMEREREKVKRIHSLAESPIEFKYKDLNVATKGFTTELGRGGYGVVYKGLLLDMKVLKDNEYTEEQFITEIKTLGKLCHQRIVKLMGFCTNKSKKILVYEFIPNNSLDKYLCQNPPNSPTLSWKQRYAIAMDVANGLSYMHEGVKQQVIHRDLKPGNILLDEGFRAKIADFGLARLMMRDQSKVSTDAKGTLGYVAPEFWDVGGRGSLTNKYDVYSYGMVMLELVAGRTKFDFHGDVRTSQRSLPDWAYNNIASPDIIVDPRIVHEVDANEVQTLIHTALWCIQKEAPQRPTMKEVVQYLDGKVPVRTDPPPPPSYIS